MVDRRLEMFRRIVGPFVLEVHDPAGTGGDEAAPDPDEWVTVDIAYPVLAAVRQLLQFGGEVEVLGPAEARDEVARAAASVTALYDEAHR